MPSRSVFFILVASFVGSIASAEDFRDDRPNIIFLMTDDQRADSLGCMGNAIIRTPHIDALAKQGVTFDQAFTTTAICMTSRACVFTGQYAARHGIWSFSKEFTPQQLSDTYLGKLKQAGYRTGFIGKWGVGHPKQADSILDFNRGFPGQSKYFAEGDPKKKIGKHLTAKLGDQALEFLDDCDSMTPFHLSISFKAPHVQDSGDIYCDPFPADAELMDDYKDVTIPLPITAQSKYHDAMPDFLKNSMNRDRWAVRFRSPARYQQSIKNYYRLISGVDTVVGRIRAKLAEANLADNTIIIFTSDHGFFLGEFGFAGKWTPHEVSIRIPLIVHDPRAEKQHGTRSDAMALLIDVAPTILELAGTQRPDSMQGQSLVSILAGKQPDSWRDSFFYEHWFDARGQIAPSEGVRTTNWKYARYLVAGEKEQGTSRWEELYDLKSDPMETTNLAEKPQFRDKLEAMRGRWT